MYFQSAIINLIKYVYFTKFYAVRMIDSACLFLLLENSFFFRILVLLFAENKYIDIVFAFK